MRTGLKRELRPMLALALPVALGELAWMAMGVVDVMMLGRVSAEAIGALSVGRALFMGTGVFGIGMLFGLDTLVSQSFGAGDRGECRRSLAQGVYLALLLTVPLMLVFRSTQWLLDALDINPDVLEPTVGYMNAMIWTMPWLLLHTAFRRYLQAINIVRPVMLALVSANLVNVVANWVLIFGNLGAPALGATGAGWATCIAMFYMVGFLAVAILLVDGKAVLRGIWEVDLARMRALVKLGLPAALAFTLEVGVFALAGVLAARLDAASLAAHQIAITAASVTFMVPLGISSAGAVRVGQAIGRKDPAGAGRAGWTATFLAAVFMLGAAAVLVTAPGPIARMFTADVAAVSVGTALLLVAAAFQLFDGVQVTLSGALRGAGDTRTPLVLSIISYWGLSLPLGYYLCFGRGHGVVGLWIGLSAGLVLASMALTIVWWRKVAALVRLPLAAPQTPD